MLDADRPQGRLFYWLLTPFLVTVFAMWCGVHPPAAMAAGPTTTHVSEGLFGNHTGEQKKESAITFVGAALQLTEAVASREIVDEVKFKEGLGKVIDGTVECLNASSWSQAK
jgi:NhaP-type Na+/H+ or K+/H+ antiporter